MSKGHWQKGTITGDQGDPHARSGNPDSLRAGTKWLRNSAVPAPAGKGQPDWRCRFTYPHEFDNVDKSGRGCTPARRKESSSMSDREQSREKGRTCSIAGCEREVLDRGWCKRHLANWRRTGDPRKVLVRWYPPARI